MKKIGDRPEARKNSLSLKISRILHAGYIFECEGTQVAFDPIFENPFSQNCYAFPKVLFDEIEIRKLKFSAVFISHFHDDHCSFESLQLLDRKTPIYIYCVFSQMLAMIRELGFTEVHSLALNKSVKIGSIEIIPRRALDAEVDSIFQIKAAGSNVLNVVDSWIDEETLTLLKSEGPWDLLLWPFQTMREIEVLAPTRAEPASGEIPREWIPQLKALNPKYLVPSSCQFQMEDGSWYNQAFFPISYKNFQNQIEAILSETKVVRMNPSVSMLLEARSFQCVGSLPWIQTLGDQNVDYEYDPCVKPHSTADIALHLPALNAEQEKRVQEYCEKEIIKIHNALEPAQDFYFNQSRLWRLSVFNHKGEAKVFFYKLKNGFLRAARDSTEDLSWTTEIPAAKLYSALENGEALTSLYIRINNLIFSEKVEKEIRYVDIIEDPLIRALFNGDFGGYQRAQLKGIQSREGEKTRQY